MGRLIREKYIRARHKSRRHQRRANVLRVKPVSFKKSRSKRLWQRDLIGDSISGPLFLSYSELPETRSSDMGKALDCACSS
jgi:hypothetical protein